MAKRDRDACLRQVLFVREIQLLRFIDGDWVKSQPIPRFELCDEWKIDARDFADPRVAAGRLPIGHQDDRHAVGRELHGSEGDALRQKLDGISKWQLDALETVSHPIGAR